MPQSAAPAMYEAGTSMRRPSNKVSSTSCAKSVMQRYQFRAP
jgi:hypothetical protein